MTTKIFDIVDATKRYKAEKYEFFLSMKSWKKFRTRYKLTWSKERFIEGGHTVIPDERGIYFFTIELSPSKLPSHGYILYIGEAGQDSQNTLRRRYVQYVREWKGGRGRPAVKFMIDNWMGDLFFNVASLPDTKVDLKQLETSLLNALIPPINKRDFDAEIMAPRAAAF